HGSGRRTGPGPGARVRRPDNRLPSVVQLFASSVLPWSRITVNTESPFWPAEQASASGPRASRGAAPLPWTGQAAGAGSSWVEASMAAGTTGRTYLNVPVCGALDRQGAECPGVCGALDRQGAECPGVCE